MLSIGQSRRQRSYEREMKFYWARQGDGKMTPYPPQERVHIILCIRIYTLCRASIRAKSFAILNSSLVFTEA